MRDFARNRQPHLQARHTLYSVTLLLHDALTGPQLEHFRRERDEAFARLHQITDPSQANALASKYREWDERFERLLDQRADQSHLLAEERASQAVAAYLHRWDLRRYHLHAYCVMSNHLHALFDLSPQLGPLQIDQTVPLDFPTERGRVDRVVGQIAGGSARTANLVLNRSGKLWMRGYHDRYIRNEAHFRSVYRYILNNPVAAGLCRTWREHAATWGRYGDDIDGVWERLLR